MQLLSFPSCIGGGGWPLCSLTSLVVLLVWRFRNKAGRAQLPCKLAIGDVRIHSKGMVSVLNLEWFSSCYPIGWMSKSELILLRGLMLMQALIAGSWRRDWGSGTLGWPDALLFHVGQAGALFWGVFIHTLGSRHCLFSPHFSNHRLRTWVVLGSLCRLGVQETFPELRLGDVPHGTHTRQWACSIGSSSQLSFSSGL